MMVRLLAFVKWWLWDGIDIKCILFYGPWVLRTNRWILSICEYMWSPEPASKISDWKRDVTLGCRHMIIQSVLNTWEGKTFNLNIVIGSSNTNSRVKFKVLWPTKKGILCISFSSTEFWNCKVKRRYESVFLRYSFIKAIVERHLHLLLEKTPNSHGKF